MQCRILLKHLPQGTEKANVDDIIGDVQEPKALIMFGESLEYHGESTCRDLIATDMQLIQPAALL